MFSGFTGLRSEADKEYVDVFAVYLSVRRLFHKRPLRWC